MTASIAHRLLGLFGISATTAAADESSGTQKIQVQILGIGSPNEVRDPVPSVQQYGFASSPVPGANHVVAFLGGDRTKGVAIGSNDPRYRPTGMKSGELMMYDNLGRQIYLSAAGIFIKANGSPVTVDDATTVTVNASTEIIANTPVLKCSGDIIDNYQTNARTMATMRSIYDGHNHPVQNVQTGSSTVTTGTPNQQE